MGDYNYYSLKQTGPYSPSSTEIWKVDRKINLGTSDDCKNCPRLVAYIALSEELQDEIPKPFANETIKRITREVFNKYYNRTFQELQKLRFHDGEYYVDKKSYDNSFTLHAFFRNPSRHYSIDLTQRMEYAEIRLETEKTITFRRGVANRSRLLSEWAFSQAFKLALEFFFDGSAMVANQAKLWETLDALTGSAEPDEPVLINDEYYYLRARELMLNRKEEIKVRLLELDDVPSKRRELRAEMKGIDYCVSILDKNH